MVTRSEKEQQVVQLRKEGKTYKEISKVVQMNYTDISSILHREFPEEYAGKIPVLSIETRALQLFTEGKTLVEVAILLNANSEDVIEYYKKYLRLKFMHSIVKMLDIHKDELRSLLLLLREVKRSGLGLKGATLAMRNKRELVEKKKELETINIQLAEKEIELARLILNTIPDRSRRKYSDIDRCYSGY